MEDHWGIPGIRTCTQKCHGLEEEEADDELSSVIDMSLQESGIESESEVDDTGGRGGLGTG